MTSKASLPGEVGGAGLRVTVSVDNRTAHEISLGNAVVNLYYGPDQTPAVSVDSDGGAPFPASVAAGHSASGAFVFTVPEASRSDVRVEVDLGIGYKVVLFRGAAPR